MTNAHMVAEFHEAFGLPVRTRPTTRIGDTERELRQSLMEEELAEYKEAVAARDIEETADALADLLYVVYGTAHAHGVPIDAVFAEVHRSNMSKLGADGKPIYRDDGKVLKGPAFKPPDIFPLLKGGS